MRFELTTPTLARLCSTPELRPRSVLPPCGCEMSFMAQSRVHFKRLVFGGEIRHRAGEAGGAYALAPERRLRYASGLLQTKFQEQSWR